MQFLVIYTMSEFLSTNGKTYHKFRNCKWINDIAEEKIVECDLEEIKDQNPCRGCAKRSDLISSGMDESIARELVS
jgi:hypothetical protein